MARSPLTLAASATAALPGAIVVGSGPLSEGAAGRFDSAVVRLDDGREVVVRTPADEASAGDLAAESRALRALTSGVRALLPFRAPEVLGETGSGTARVLVVDLLEGYRVEPANVPKGDGAATAIGGALAAIHALPPSVVRTDGLPVRTPTQVRDEVARLVDRAEATRRVPDVLLERWRRALDTDALWRFESAVVLGGATSASVLLTESGTEDVDLRIAASGVLDWGGLSVGDPATDLRWLASAPLAADDVFAGYSAAAGRAPDELLRERARLYAELEFARWLVHGDDEGRSDVVADAVALLDALAEGVRGDQIVPDPGVDVDAALALVERMPETSATAVDTSMQTDAYDPEMVSLFLAAERDRLDREGGTPDFGLDGLRDAPEETQPIDLTGWSEVHEAEPSVEAADGVSDGRGETPDDDEIDLEEEAERASRAALRRWSAGGA
jgi:aminoglycoside phosphotransferase (APT) family kinase protein